MFLKMEQNAGQQDVMTARNELVDKLTTQLTWYFQRP
jgi:hypothetical protein